MVDSTGEIDRLVPETSFQVPSGLEIRNGQEGPALYWPVDADWTPGKGRDVLRDFIELLPRSAQASKRSGEGAIDPDRVLMFAREYGALELCEHGEPHSHPHNPTCRPSGYELLVHWERYAVRARAIVSLGAALHRGGKGDDSDWLAFGTHLPTSSREARVMLEATLNWWLMVLGDVSPVFTWSPIRTPQVRLRAKGVLGAVARQLAFAVARSRGFAVCAGCGTRFVPARAPRLRSGRLERSWCQECRDGGESKKAANRDYMRRKRKQP